MKFGWMVPGLLTLVLTACPKQKDDASLTAGEAKQALEEASVASQAEGLTSAAVEITTSLTIGQAVENAAEEIRSFIAAQLPCAAISVSGATVTVEYGAKAGNCTYRGQTFRGSHAVTVEKNTEGEVLVHHVWTDLSNGKVELNGTADVTWSFTEKSRRVVHTAEWTRLSDGFSVTGEGDRLQAPLDGGLAEGFQVDGSRSWTSLRGTWDLAIDGVEMRWIDPVPQAGSYTLSTPNNRSLGLSFSRVDEDTIQVTVSNGSKSFSFNVSKLGSVESA
jgi:hypothetical protein